MHAVLLGPIISSPKVALGVESKGLFDVEADVAVLSSKIGQRISWPRT